MKIPIRERMQEIANAVNDRIPVGWGFFILVAPTDLIKEGDARSDYVSNLAREETAALMKEWIEKVEKDKFGKHL